MDNIQSADHIAIKSIQYHMFGTCVSA